MLSAAFVIGTLRVKLFYSNVHVPVLFAKESTFGKLFIKENCLCWLSKNWVYTCIMNH